MDEEGENYKVAYCPDMIHRKQRQAILYWILGEAGPTSHMQSVNLAAHCLVSCCGMLPFIALPLADACSKA